MKKRVFPCLLVVAVALLPLHAPAGFSQAQRTTRAAQTGLKTGFYFTVDTCRACYYTNWQAETVRLFKQNALPVTIYEGKEIETRTEKFAPVKLFPKQGLWSDLIWVGPFESEKAATDALDKFPGVLSFIQRKRSKQEGRAADAGWPVSDTEKVTRTSGNDYKYGFFFIKGYRLFP